MTESMESINSITVNERQYIDYIVENQLCNSTRFNWSKQFKKRIKKYGFCPCEIDEYGEPLKVPPAPAVMDLNPRIVGFSPFSPEEMEQHRKECFELNDEIEDTFLMFKSLRPYAFKYPERIGNIELQPIGLADDTTISMIDIQDTLDSIHGISEEDRHTYNQDRHSFQFFDWNYINGATIDKPLTKDTKLLIWFKNEGTM
jgi:hypothetical protein